MWQALVGITGDITMARRDTKYFATKSSTNTSWFESEVRVAFAHVAHGKRRGRGAELRVGVRVFRFLLFAAARGRIGGVACSILAAGAGGSQAEQNKNAEGADGVAHSLLLRRRHAALLIRLERKET